MARGKIPRWAAISVRAYQRGGLFHGFPLASRSCLSLTGLSWQRTLMDSAMTHELFPGRQNFRPLVRNQPLEAIAWPCRCNTLHLQALNTKTSPYWLPEAARKISSPPSPYYIFSIPCEHTVQSMHFSVGQSLNSPLHAPATFFAAFTANVWKQPITYPHTFAVKAEAYLWVMNLFQHAFSG